MGGARGRSCGEGRGLRGTDPGSELSLRTRSVAQVSPECDEDALEGDGVGASSVP